MLVMRRRLIRGAKTERGAVAVIVALSMVMLLVAGAMVLDFGIVRVDRQEMKLAADDAVMSGLRAESAGTSDIYTYRGVCGALAFLKANQPVFKGLSDDYGTCTSSPPPDYKCDTSDPFGSPGAAYFKGSVTSGDTQYTVVIKAPYLLSDGNFSEESYASLSGDTSSMGGCDQLGVIISLQKKPGLGSIATSADLKTRIRSVGRFQIGDGDTSPALLLLERSACGVLVVGSSGSPSRIEVVGSTAPPMYATIHSDSTATGAGCGSGSNQQLFQGNQSGGIVAYGDGTNDGKITSVATDNGVAANIVSDSSANVYGTNGIFPTTTDMIPVQPRALVTRGLVDKRYLNGVATMAESAYSEWIKDHSSPTGYVRFGCPTAADMTTLGAEPSTAAVYIDCPTSSGITLNGSITAGTVFFHGYIKGGSLSMPNATKVYIDDTDNTGAKVNKDAILVNNNQAFCVRATSCDPASPSTGTCSTSPSFDPSAKAQFFIRRGNIDGAGNSSLLRLCSTTVIMEGGQIGAGNSSNPGACLPMSGGALAFGTAPTSTPCTGMSSIGGSGQISTSGFADWTAPNAYEDLSQPPINDDKTAKQTLWDGGEDLALWDESYGDNSSNTFSMAGGGMMHVAGVFMVPNAAPFHITGSGTQDLTNSQYIVTRFSVGGGAVLKMGVDPYNSVPDPELTPFTLVR